MIKAMDIPIHPNPYNELSDATDQELPTCDQKDPPTTQASGILLMEQHLSINGRLTGTEAEDTDMQLEEDIKEVTIIKWQVLQHSGVPETPTTRNEFFE